MRPIDADRLKEDLTRFYDGEVCARDLIDSQPTIEPAQQWIPCSERLPEYGNVVIVSVLDTSGDTAFDYTATGWIAPSGDFWVVDGELCSGIIAWQPLPEPYREEEHEQKT